MKTHFNVGSRNKQSSDDNTTQIQIGIWPFWLLLTAVAVVLIYWLKY